MTQSAALPEQFAWDGDHIAVRAPGGQALFTTRRGGDQDMALVARQIGIGVDRWAQSRQVHEARVVSVRDPYELHSGPSDADGQATSAAGVACVVLTADCLPVALLAEEAVAMVHAGWRGLAAGVLEAGVEAVRELGARSEITAAIGPGAGGCCYEVGPEVLAAFGIDGEEHAMLDLKRIAARRLRECGVDTVTDVGLCTMCSDPGLFFSYRRDGGATGRQAGLAWRS